MADGWFIRDTYSCTKAGVLSIASMGANWTNASRTVADMGTLTTVVMTSGSLYGGAIESTPIGGSTAAAGTFTKLSASAGLASTGGNISGSHALNIAGKVNLQGVGADAIAAGETVLWINEGKVATATIDSIADIFAGTNSATGLSDSSGVISVNINGLDPQQQALVVTDSLMIYDASATALRKVGPADMISGSLGLLTEAAMDVADDYILFLDGGATGAGKKEKWADVASAIAGSGITATNGVLSADSAGTPNSLTDGET